MKKDLPRLPLDIRNADWMRTLSWDLPTDPDEFLKTVKDVKAFMDRPAAEAMPKALKKELQRRKLL